MTSEKPLISVIVPVFNEEENVERCYEVLCQALAEVEDEYRLEIFFSDNHSTDNTFPLLSKIASGDERVRVIRLSRNFGFQRSLLTAYLLVAGDAAVQLDADLQDPPALILDFLKCWREGHDVVVGRRIKREESRLLQFARRTFYRLLRQISDESAMDDAGDFRLVDRSVLERLRLVRDHSPYVRGLTSALASNPTAIPYSRVARSHGESKFPVLRLFGFAFQGIISHSIVPLRLATWIGAGAFVVTTLLFLYYFLSFAVSGGEWPEGFATQTMLLLASISLNSILVGILGEYVGRIYNEVRVRPLTVIESAINLDVKPANETLVQARSKT